MTPSSGGAGRVRVLPTVFGCVVAVVLVAALVLRPPAADPSVAGLVWAGLLGAAAFGLVWPVVAVRSQRVEVLDAPVDLQVGQPAVVELRVDGRGCALSVGVVDSGMTTIDVAAPGVLRLPFTVPRRGVLHRLRIELGTDAPFGVSWAGRTLEVELPHALLVGPAPAPQPGDAGPLRTDAIVEHAPSSLSAGGDAVRAVRPYVPGDPAHLVHWPTTARLGELVVRELEPPARSGLAVVVDLRADDLGSEHAGAEDVASRAAGVCQRLLDDGAVVVLCTVEPTGPVVAQVGDRVDVSRRLARAVPGPPPSAPPGWPELVLGPVVDHAAVDQASADEVAVDQAAIDQVGVDAAVVDQVAVDEAGRSTRQGRR